MGISWNTIMSNCTSFQG